MKVREILPPQQLDEFNLKHAAAAGVAGMAMMSPMKGKEINVNPLTAPAKPVTTVLPEPKQVDPKQQKMAQVASDKYDLDDQFAQQVVELAHKYEKPTFPRAKDILAIIGIESSFNPDAKSGLRRDKAVGLMQVRPHVWNMTPAELANTETSIATGSDILHLYFKKLRNRDAAVAAYNVGMSEYRSGNKAEGYVSKYMHELKLYAGI